MAKVRKKMTNVEAQLILFAIVALL